MLTLFKLNNLEKSSLVGSFIKEHILRAILLGCFRGTISHTDIFEAVEQYLEEEGDDDICLQCAEALTGIPTKTLCFFIDRGIIPCFELDGDTFISAQDLLFLVDPYGEIDPPNWL